MIYLLVAFMALSMNACHFNGMLGTNIQGSGIVVSEIRSVEGFESISASHISKVFVTTGEDFFVEVVTDDNIQPHLETYVRGNTLYIGNEQGVNFQPATKVHIHVRMPVIFEISTSGASEVHLETELDQPSLNLKSSGSSDIFLGDVFLDELMAQASGSSDIHLAGYAEFAKISTSGSSDFRGSGFSCNTAEVRLSGSSDVWVRVHEMVSGSLSGSSDLHLQGDPVVNISTSGSSGVHR